ncbi:SRPBCC family protein [Actinomadura parmotrematis]|uniref:SRPBCC family protein n=1 Tax=Actinomadura parmotrematis TaxID=2864039 RepID=A0ABS7G5J4_9ACTN|nr:SRPBCC family protein [Actinomadura parmotrematis]MBW8487645.1 SRPBCC family protein [Actinomadura parmotrematis]
MTTAARTGPRPYASAVLNASADEVWAYLRDFGNLAEWTPGGRTAVIEDGGPADRVGCVRRVIGPGDTVFRERLTGLDDAARSYSYAVLECPLPISGAHGTLRVSPAAGGRALVEWSGGFSADPADEEAMTKTLTHALYGTGLAALRRRFG